MNHNLIPGALLAAAFSFAAHAQTPSELLVSGTEDTGAAPIATNLEQLRETPDAYRGVKVTFTAQYCGIGQVSNPFFTRFTPAEYANFYVWSDGQELWREKQYDDVFGFCFLPKTSAQLAQLYEVQAFDRLQITAVVRNTFRRHPWLEVIKFEPVEGKVDVATLAHLFRAEQAMERRQWEKAIQELKVARKAPTTDAVAAGTAKNLAISYLRMGESTKATMELRLAHKLYQGKDMETRRLLGIASEAPETELDRQVTNTAVEAHLRPMWEAFENESDPFAQPVSPTPVR